MPRLMRRSIADNLDPLVDTLSNVVGILVIVLALTQIQLGDALARVVELDAKRALAESLMAPNSAKTDSLELRRDALIRRADSDVEDAEAVARKTLAALAETPKTKALPDNETLEILAERVESSSRALEVRRTNQAQRGEYADRLTRVPKHMVARLPDPMILHGKESWILVRYGRIHLVDREALFEEGQRAIARILDPIIVDGTRRQIRPEEYATIARYFRKRATGVDNFRWQFRIEPRPHVELAWLDRDAGIEYAELARSGEMRAWLARRSPDMDLIQFHVWGDSFEAYLAAREVIETTGFNAGWIGHEPSEELVAPLRFGPPDPISRRVRVD